MAPELASLFLTLALRSNILYLGFRLNSLTLNKSSYIRLGVILVNSSLLFLGLIIINISFTIVMVDYCFHSFLKLQG